MNIQLTEEQANASQKIGEFIVNENNGRSVTFIGPVGLRAVFFFGNT